jgi:hypothetical protein
MDAKKREADKRPRKAVQLTVNLMQAVTEIADQAGKELCLATLSAAGAG